MAGLPENDQPTFKIMDFQIWHRDQEAVDEGWRMSLLDRGQGSARHGDRRGDRSRYIADIPAGAPALILRGRDSGRGPEVGWSSLPIRTECLRHDAVPDRCARRHDLLDGIRVDAHRAGPGT